MPVIVLAFFVFASPASGLIIAPDTALEEVSGVGNPIPVVVLVLDELPVQTLMDPDGNIDSSRYPGFASLLDDFTWFRNTSTMHHHTEHVLPMIITGVPAQEDLEASSLGYPDNLFTMLGNSHDVWAHEELTDFCGPEICTEQPHPGAVERWQLLLGDTSVVAAHVVLPAGATTWLPPLDDAWAGFGPGEPAPRSERPQPNRRRGFSLRGVSRLAANRRAAFPPLPSHPRPALSLARLARRSLLSGRRRTSHKGNWGDDQHVVDLAHQAHMLQTGYVDTQIVRFLDEIRNTNWYDDALVMVTADHGIAFTAGGLVRGGIAETVDDIAYVPLFVKPPGQIEGGIDDRPAMLYDVLPTIVDVLEVESPWPMEGVSLIEGQPAGSRQRTFEGHEVVEIPPNPVLDDAITRKVDLFGSGTGWDTVYNFGPYRDLAGQAAETLIGEDEPAEIDIIDETLYERVDPATGIVPALIRASVDSGTINADTWLAVAVNGIVAGTAHVQRWTPANHDYRITEPPTDFAVIVPPTSFIDGKNEIDLYRIEETDRGLVLHHLQDD